MNYLDLFSGIGGFPKGMHAAGIRVDAHYFSEVDPWAVELYQKRFPEAIPAGDIRGIDGKVLADTASADAGRRTGEQQGQESANGQSPQLLSDSCGGSGEAATGGDWLITGGFPCQDISYAGKGAGLAGARSGLFYEAHRIIRELGPRIVVLENVRALLTRGIGDVLGALSDIGYDCEWEVIRASDVGAPHRRERVWIVAYPEEHAERAGLCESGEGRQRGRRPGDSGGAVPDTDKQPAQRATEPWRECNHWTVEPEVGRLAHGIPHRVDRLRGLGNAIVPQIAELIFRQIRSAA